MNPFVDITVHPSYGTHDCVIRWVVQDAYRLGEFTVYRSYDDVEFEALNDKAPVIDGSGVFLDTTLDMQQRFERVKYRIYLRTLDEQDFDSPIVGPYDKLSPREFRIVRRMLQSEFRNMSSGRSGLEAVVLKPRRRGPYCSCVDATTGQGLQTSVCPLCYGTGFEGGFLAPVKTWVVIEQVGPAGVGSHNSGASDVTQSTLRTLAYPTLLPGDLVVFRAQDARYEVGKVESFLFRGLIPIVHRLQSELLPRRDIRYTAPLP